MKLSKLPKKRNRAKTRTYKYYGRKISRLVRPVAYVFLLAGFCWAFYIAVFRSSFFKIRNIEVIGGGIFVNTLDLTEVAKSNSLGKNIFLLNTAELENNLRINFQGAKEISASKELPGTIKIDVKERTPLALIYTGDSEELYMVDEEGYVLGLVDSQSSNLPKIRYEGDVKVGFFVDRKMVPEYLELVNVLNSQKVNVSSMSFYPRYIKLYVNDGIETFIGMDKDKKSSVTVLSELLKQLLLEEKKVKKIDLRYDKVIVSYE